MDNNATKTQQGIGIDNFTFDLQRFGVCQIGTTEYDTIADAIAAATNAQTITMIKDVTDVSSAIEVSKTITLDLNGKTISGNISNYFINITSSVTIKDSSTDGTGKIQNTTDDGYGYGINVDSNGTLTVESGIIYSDNRTIYNVGTLTISNGTFKSTTSSAIWNVGTLTISNGTFTGATNAIYSYKGTSTISGGTFTGGNYAIHNGSNSTTEISGGTFTGGNYAIYNGSNSTTEISGGTFTGSNYAIHNYNGTAKISGGTFKDIESLSTSDGKTLEVTYGKVTATVSNGSITKIEGIAAGETVTYNGKALSTTSTTEITANFSNGNITSITGLSEGASVTYDGKTYAHTITLPEGVTTDADANTLTIDGTTYYADGSTITISGFGEGKTISFDDGISSLEVSDSNILAKDGEETAFTLSGLTLSESATSWKVDGTSASYGKKIIGTGAKINGTTITYVAAETFESTFTLSNLAADLTEEDLNAAVSVSGSTITINSDSVLDKTKSVLNPAGYNLALGSNVTKNENKIRGEWKQDTADTAKYTYFDAGNTGGFAYGKIPSSSSTLETGIYYVEDTRTTITVSDLATGLSTDELTKGISISFSGSTYKITFNSADVLNKKTPTITTTAKYTVEVASSLNPSWQNPNWNITGTAATLSASTSDGYEVSNNAVVYIEESNAASRFEISGLAAGVEELSAPTGTVLTLNADQLGNNAIIRGNAGNFTVQVEGNMTGKILSGTSNADTITMAASGALVKANSGDDEINVTGENVTVIGGKGDDKITVNASAVVSFDANSGNDTVYGYKSGSSKIMLTVQDDNDRYTVENGDNTVIKIGNSTLTLDGVTSFNSATDIIFVNEKIEYPVGISVRKDTLTASAAFTGNEIKLSDYPADVTKINAAAVSKAVTLEGNSLANSLVGGKNNDKIDGGAGNDKLYGEKGNDTISGGAGNDTLYSGDGNDVFIYEGGNDYIADYAAGSDSIQIDFTKVTAQSVSGSNVILTIDEDNTVTIKGAKDKEITFVDASGNSDTKIFFNNTYYAPLDDGLKYDSKRVSLTADSKFAGTEIDLANYLSTVEKVNASAVTKDFTIKGNNNGNSILSGKGNDVITVGDGTNSVRGGDGNDNITGGTGNDILKGENGNDILNGGAGNNTLTGGAGSDTFVAGAGNDIITDYTAGQDKINATFTASTLKGSDVVLTTESGGTVTIKSAKNKTVTFVYDDGTTNDLIFFNDTYYAPLDTGLTYNTNRTQLTAGSTFKGTKIDLPNDYLDTVQKVGVSAVKQAVEIVGNSINNSIVGSAYVDSISGELGNDTLNGGNGADSINGGEGNDILKGEAGNDTLSGGAGNDTLYGGAGKDVFIYDGGNDYIADYTAGDDSIKATFKTSKVTGSNVVLTTEDGTITIKGAKNKTITFVDDDGTTADWIFFNETYYAPLDTGLTYNTNKTQLTAGSTFSGAKIDLAADYLDTVQKVSANAVTKTIEIVGNDLNNSIKGGTANDIISGDLGNDTLNGGNGADSINGGEGNDKLYGDAGNDTLIGGAGSNTLTGGAGSDTFVVGAGNDFIADYTAGEEIKIASGAISDYSYSGKNITFTLDNKNSFTVKNARGKEITITDASGATATEIYPTVKANAQTYDLLYDNNFVTDEFALDDITEEKFEVTEIQTATSEIAQEDKTLITYTDK